MKNFTPLFLACLAGLTLSAQTADFQITVTRDQNINTAMWLNTMTMKFSASGSHYSDALDQPGSVTNNTYMYPYTIDSGSVDLIEIDSRPEIRSTLTVPFGVWTEADGDMHVRGEWANPNATNLYNVILTDLQTGLTYDLYSEVVISVLIENEFNNRFTITFIPKASYIGFDESCFGSSNGSVFAQSPEPDWTVHIYRNSVFLNTLNVAGTDTLFQNLATGTYDFIYELDNQVTDTASAIVSGPVAVVSSATISNTSPIENTQVDFTNTSTGAMDYSWDFGDSFTSTDVSPSHTYSVAGTYTVTLTAYNIAGCNEIATYIINVQPTPMAQPQLMDRNNLQEQNTQRNAATVTAQNGQAQITTETNSMTQVMIYSITGQLIHSGTSVSNQYTFTYEAPGIYVAHIHYSDGRAEIMQVSLN